MRARALLERLTITAAATSNEPTIPPQSLPLLPSATSLSLPPCAISHWLGKLSARRTERSHAGILLSSAALLYNLTTDGLYLRHVASLLAAAAANMTNSLGAPRDEQRGARSQVPADSATGASS